MIVILEPGIDKSGADYTAVMDYLTNQPGIQVRVHEESGVHQVLTELYLVGD
ncbi:MAG TPA: 3-deoxy-7-phosphoheptulonate synthase, partial [Candidatus Tenderia electrophaga]|nr:3-deoxy-7-phosphoheptulonate synthase [Candidatus Tenderia electrophaga]